jgi:ComF family protein
MEQFMISNIVSDVSRKLQQLFDQWKYLLLQEECRLCKRLIHPLIEHMDFESYGPPAHYLIAHREVVSDVICQFCLSNLATCQAVINTRQFNWYQNDLIKENELLIASGAIFVDPVQSLILRLKYAEDVLLAKDLSCLMYRAWQLLSTKICNDKNNLCLVPVPLHKKRMHERGFNQANILCEHLGRLLKINVETKMIRRVRNTKSQQKLSKTERLSNVIGAFKCNANSLSGKQIILVDDVSTSGATLIECAKVLKSAGAKSVHALTVACVP